MQECPVAMRHRATRRSARQSLALSHNHAGWFCSRHCKLFVYDEGLASHEDLPSKALEKRQLPTLAQKRLQKLRMATIDEY